MTLRAAAPERQFGDATSMEPDLVRDLIDVLRRADAATDRSARLAVRSRKAVAQARVTIAASSEQRSARWRRRYEVAYRANLSRLPELDLLAS